MSSRSRVNLRKPDRRPVDTDGKRAPRRLPPDEADPVGSASDLAAQEDSPDGELERLLRDAVALEEMLRKSLTGTNGAAPTSATADQPGSSRRPRRRLYLAMIATAVVLGLIVTAGVLVHRHTDASKRPNRVATPTTAAEISAAASWAARELARDTQILADPVMSAALTAKGFTGVQRSSAGSDGISAAAPLTFDYVVSTAAARATDGSGKPIDRALKSSLPIAVFGSGDRQVIVQQVTTASLAAVASRRRHDEHVRLRAERQLLTNAAIHVSTAARAILQAGRLDLRAATVLAFMAASSHIDIITVNVDGPERLAGLPARSIDVRLDPAPAAQALLANLPPSYRPGTDVLLPHGTERLVWQLDPEPPTVLD